MVKGLVKEMMNNVFLFGKPSFLYNSSIYL
jgi:hypothetical protein